MSLIQWDHFQLAGLIENHRPAGTPVQTSTGFNDLSSGGHKWTASIPSLSINPLSGTVEPMQSNAR
jgi:hypothetical protein